MKKTRLLLPAVLIILMLTGCGLFEPKITGFTVNEKPTKTGMPVAAGMKLYDATDEDIRFLYPDGETVSYDKADGVAIYTSEKNKIPYLLIKRYNKAGMTPEKFFKACDDQLIKSFAEVRSTTIHEVRIDNKVLYMTRYVVKDKAGTSIVIERYVELYDKFYIQYTAVSEKENTLDTELYYSIKTLSTAEGAYTTGIATSLTAFKDAENGIEISLPDMLKVSTLTIGFFATSSSTIELCVRCTADDNGTPITSRQAFLDRAAADSGFVAGYLGVESVAFGSGELATINGLDYYCYPMTMVSQGTSFSGKIYLADADGGCLVACYGVNASNPDIEKITNVCESSIKTLKYSKP